jgi:hypothetical protein
MKLPVNYDDDVFGHESGILPNDRTSPCVVYSLVYPPPGFFPFYGIGNGDYHGYYWPIGREDGPPIIAFSSHDAWSLIPENTDIESLYRCQLAKSDDEDDSLHEYLLLAETALGKAPQLHNVRGLPQDDFIGLLSLDSTSPFYLCAAADVDVANNELESAEQRYRQSLDQLPEYVAAHFGLAYLLRRLRRGAEAAVHLRHALLGPCAFYGGSFWSDTALPGSFRNDWSRKALLWLQGSKKVDESIANDAFIQSIHKLKFQTGLAVNPDDDVLRTILDQYVAQGQYLDAAQIWRLCGDRASFETTTFRERLGMNPLTYGTRLAELLRLAGNTARADLILSMLSKMNKPESYQML